MERSPALRPAKSLHCLHPQGRGFEGTPQGCTSCPMTVSAQEGHSVGTGSAGPGFPVLRVLMAPVGPQSRGALSLDKSCCQGGQVGAGSREGAAPTGLGGALQPKPRAAPPACARCPAHPARPHQQPVARVALEVLLPSDGAIVLT